MKDCQGGTQFLISSMSRESLFAHTAGDLGTGPKSAGAASLEGGRQPSRKLYRRLSPQSSTLPPTNPYFKIQNPTTKNKKCRAKPQRRIRQEYRPVLHVPSSPKYGESQAEKQIVVVPEISPTNEPEDSRMHMYEDVHHSLAEQNMNNEDPINRPTSDPQNSLDRAPRTQIHEKKSSPTNAAIAEPTRETAPPKFPTPDLKTPIAVSRNSPPKSQEPATSRVDENLWRMNQIEGHSLTGEDRRSRDHILYNLPNLNSLPKRSSTSMSYLSASQRKIKRKNTSGEPTDEDEIQSRLRAAEERIACVPIHTFKRFQILQRGSSRQGATPSKASSL